MINRNNRQPMAEPLGSVRRRFYGMYKLVHHAQPGWASHQAVCDLPDDLDV